MKALIVAGSRGDEVGLIGIPARELVPVANRAIVLHALDRLRWAGVAEVAIAACPATATGIRTAIADDLDIDLRIEYIVREGPSGIGHAILAAERFLSGSPFLVQTGHGFSTASLRPLVERLMRRPPHGLVLGAPPDEDEMPIDDALALLLDRGRVQRETTAAWWGYDGTPAKLLEGNRLALDQVAGARPRGTVEDSEIGARVTVHPTARVRSSVIRGPAVIGAAARISDAYIGPHTSIGDHVVVEGAEVEDSVVLHGATIRHLPERLQGSIVGRDVKLFRDFRLPKAYRLVVGTGAEIALA